MTRLRAQVRFGPLVRDLVRRAAPFTPAEDGWATHTLADSIRRVLLLATVGCQLVMLGAIFASDRPIGSLLPLLVAHVAVLFTTLVVRAGRLPLWLPIVGVDLLFVADWWAAASMNDPLLFAACWMFNLSSAMPAFVLRGRLALAMPAATVVLVPVAMLVTRPELPTTLPISVFVTRCAIVLATRICQTYLYDFAGRADATTIAAQRRRAAAATQEAASRASAEDARVLHDTVINTLAALASGGAAVRDADAVRERCARDIATVSALRDGAEPATDNGGLRAASFDPRIRVRHRGLDDDELARLEDDLLPARLRALRRAATELVQNAAKHAGVGEVDIRAEERDGRLVVTVADDGVGFDGQVGTSGGLAVSVLDRAREAGIEVDLDTAPGAGTRVTLTVPTTGAPPAKSGTERNIASIVQVLRRDACLLYAAGVSIIGFYLAVTNHPGEATPEYLMAGLSALGAGVAWRTTRRRESLPTWVVVLLTAAAAVGFVLSAAAVDYGREDPVLWQAIGATGPLIVITELGPRRSMAVWAALSYGAVVVAVAVAVGQSSQQAETITLIAGAAGLGLVAGWARFQHTIGAIGTQAAADQRAGWAADTRLAEREAADRSRARWRVAGLNRSLELLEAVYGATDPGAPALRERCASEEAYLRQLTLLHPDLVHVGQWFARALSDAHERGVRLVVRAGGTDLPAEMAAGVGDVVLAAVAETPRGTDLTVTLFPAPEGVRMTLVGAHPHVTAGIRSASGPIAVSAQVLSVGGQDVAELLLDVPA
ncbi:MULTISPECIES: ATP-binding protein [unclassified Nocardioides]|uniref:sensor histidine kinase n=1 Tax=unclassified Nocardioides TaxID=2615069 RepID=UPI0011696209|nr:MULTISPECIES: ATP-binding protein [unclassified Nocardioides]TQK73285.1 signal transduction histidine kinase [Nocardioides sp. SLBN-35]WGY02478.1 ATP-binding protein [Nocardioides sp. QY071]